MLDTVFRPQEHDATIQLRMETYNPFQLEEELARGSISILSLGEYVFGGKGRSMTPQIWLKTASHISCKSHQIANRSVSHFK